MRTYAYNLTVTADTHGAASFAPSECKWNLMICLRCPIHIPIPIPSGILNWEQYPFLCDSCSDAVLSHWNALGQNRNHKLNQSPYVNQP